MRTIIRDINIPLLHNNLLVLRLVVQPNSIMFCFHHVNVNTAYVYTVFDNSYELLSEYYTMMESSNTIICQNINIYKECIILVNKKSETFTKQKMYFFQDENTWSCIRDSIGLVLKDMEEINS